VRCFHYQYRARDELLAHTRMQRNGMKERTAVEQRHCLNAFVHHSMRALGHAQRVKDTLTRGGIQFTTNHTQLTQHLNMDGIKDHT